MATDSTNAIHSDLQLLRQDIMRLVRKQSLAPSVRPTPAFATIVWRVTEVETSISCGEYMAAAECAQRLQWGALQAQAWGAISRDESMRLLYEAQILCEDLWAHERHVTHGRET